jgi:hypothetical protein
MQGSTELPTYLCGQVETLVIQGDGQLQAYHRWLELYGTIAPLPFEQFAVSLDSYGDQELEQIYYAVHALLYDVTVFLSRQGVELRFGLALAPVLIKFIDASSTIRSIRAKLQRLESHFIQIEELNEANKITDFSFPEKPNYMRYMGKLERMQETTSLRDSPVPRSKLSGKDLSLSQTASNINKWACYLILAVAIFSTFFPILI